MSDVKLPLRKGEHVRDATELCRKRAGKRTKTKMTEEQLEEFASKPKGKSHKRKHKDGL